MGQRPSSRPAAAFFTVGLAASAVLAFQVARAQTPAAAAQFRAGVNLVQLDVSVLDKKTHLPVRGLTAGDFTIREDDTFHKVEAFAAVDVPDPPPLPMVDGKPVTWMREVPPDVQSNASAGAPDSRLFVLLIDDAMIPLDPAIVKQAKQAAMSIIDKLAPSDRMAVVLSAESVHAQDFTTDRAKMRAAVEKMRPGFAQYYFGWDNWPPPELAGFNLGAWQPTQATDGDITVREMSLGTLTAVAEALIAVPERRKTLIYISPGIPMNPGWAATIKMANGEGLVSYEANKRLVTELPELFRRMQRANVNIYAFDPTGLDGMSPIVAHAITSIHRAGNSAVDPVTGQSASYPFAPELGHFAANMDLNFLLAAAENTGGRAIVNTNDLEPGIDEMFRENGSFYLLGYTAPPTDPPGTLHRLRVTVNRTDVDVRTRSGFYTPKIEQVDPKKPPMTPMNKAVASPLPSADLPLRVAVAPVVWIPPPAAPPVDERTGLPKRGKPAPPPGPEATAVVVLGLERPAPSKPLSDTIEVQISAFTPDGFARGTDTQLATVAVRESTTAETVRYEALSHIALKPGRYQLRVAALSGISGVTGSVYADVEVPDFLNDAVSMSGVFVSLDPGPRSAPRSSLAPILPVVPTSERAFFKLDAATVFLRVYEGGTAPAVAATLTTRLVNERNFAVVNTTETLAPERFDTRARGADVRFNVPLVTLARGQYLLSFDAAVGDTHARRDLRFTVK